MMRKIHGRGVVDPIVTDLAVIAASRVRGGLALVERAPGLAEAGIVERSGAPPGLLEAG